MCDADPHSATLFPTSCQVATNRTYRGPSNPPTPVLTWCNRWICLTIFSRSTPIFTGGYRLRIPAKSNYPVSLNNKYIQSKNHSWWRKVELVNRTRTTKGGFVHKRGNSVRTYFELVLTKYILNLWMQRIFLNISGVKLIEKQNWILFSKRSKIFEKQKMENLWSKILLWRSYVVTK